MQRLVLLLLCSGACGSLPGGGGSILSRHGQCGTPIDGIVFLGWTLRGAVPSTQSCQGVDHLSIDIDGGSCGATISPVPCALDRWRYDNLPEGDVFVTVNAVALSGAVVMSGSADLFLTASVPSSPSPVDLQ